jgi:RHH-type proline utilization regulon transcriptional repressor/proline dehydrogenase/delta 1-pyrroline-5-carboxylate dehydrogenase
MVNHKDVAGVAFTGSTEVAKLIQISLAKKDGPIVPLIAETGGQNAMIVDSSALPEQVVDDVILSAFGSAGQRCSALRVLYLQDDIADKTISMLKGAMKVLHVGDPAHLSTDVGPVIDGDALKILKDHQVRLDAIGTKITQAPMAANLDGHYFAPCAYEINSLNDLEREVFGPILHIIRYSGRELDKVIEQINEAGYGLTLGIHSRIRETQKYITSRVEVGNVYINRSMTGAVVGTQPFGGMGLSGTGPKAGGPDYLHAFGTEMVVSTDTTRQGGNATLVSLTETS